MVRSFQIRVLLFCLPMFGLMFLYITMDVFRVIYNYHPYYDKSCYIDVNRAYGSTMTYINQNPIYHYDSFIFGNSRSRFYEIDEWKKYLPDGCRCMHFDGSVGSIRGLHDKVVYIDRNGGKLANALLVIDTDLLSNLELTSGHLLVSPPILSGYSDFLNFHLQHFAAFLHPQFLIALADFKLFGICRPYMDDFFFNWNEWEYVPQYNEFQYITAERNIKDNVYYNSAAIKFWRKSQKPGTISSVILEDKSIAYLQEIKTIFDKHHTSYKIVISPLYNQIKLNRGVYDKLCEIFGGGNIYDFSGINKWNVDYHNYYEPSHYRPKVSAEILSIMYSQQH